MNSLSPNPHAQVDGSGTEIPASIRLRDYLARSQYPETNRLLQSGDVPLFETPLVPGDASAAATIVAFTGDSLQRGSLQISFRVQVHEPGFYSFRTHLLTENSRPLVEVLVHQQLQAGEQTLQFVVYGKAIRDAGYAGPFLIPGIVGEKLPAEVAGGAARQGALKHFTVPNMTKTYKAKDFTNSPWTSREKRAIIKRLQREIQLTGS